jgi:hypothetical protein
MIEQLSLSDIILGVITTLRKNIDPEIPILDYIPENQKLPFISVEMVGVESIPSKTMWKDRYQIYIHGWADGSQGSVPIFDLSDKIREAMTTKVNLPNQVDLLLQQPTGTQRILQDEEHVRHAVLGYALTVTYGFKMKI